MEEGLLENHILYKSSKFIYNFKLGLYATESLPNFHTILCGFANFKANLNFMNIDIFCKITQGRAFLI